MKCGNAILIASGDLRLSANQICWPAQAELESLLTRRLDALGVRVSRIDTFKADERHGFIASQREGMNVFSRVDRGVPLIVAVAGWQYSHHVLAGLVSHQGPILTVANWSGQWPGLVGLLNLNGSMTKAGVKYSSLWSETLEDEYFNTRLSEWVDTGNITHDASHVSKREWSDLPRDLKSTVDRIYEDIQRNKAILGVFDEGCMGMYNAIIPDELLMPLGFYKERLSQSALYHRAMRVPDSEAISAFDWLVAKGMTFNFGEDPESQLTKPQVLDQLKTYLAAARIADEFGCEAIGIQYQQGLKDLLPASDLAEGLLNNDERPPVRRDDGSIIRDGRAIVHFNEVDECAGIDGVMTNRLHRAFGQPVENTLHDVRWGAVDPISGEFIWVFEISGAAPPAHHRGGYAGTSSHRQPAMFFRLGGGTVRGVAKPGEIIWSRVFVEGGRLKMDVGRGKAVALSAEETERRWRATTYEWPIMHAVLYGVSRDQMMARHKANHIQVAYATDSRAADQMALAKGALAARFGIDVAWCGTMPPA